MATMSKETFDEIVNDPIKFMKRILDMGIDPIFPRIFPFQTQTKTSINSRMETITEGKTVKADTGKLIEYKPVEEE